MRSSAASICSTAASRTSFASGAQPVLSPTELKPNDLIRIGRTTLAVRAVLRP